jgi:hypothetical protein
VGADWSVLDLIQPRGLWWWTTVEFDLDQLLTLVWACRYSYSPYVVK